MTTPIHHTPYTAQPLHSLTHAQGPKAQPCSPRRVPPIYIHLPQPSPSPQHSPIGSTPYTGTTIRRQHPLYGPIPVSPGLCQCGTQYTMARHGHPIRRGTAQYGMARCTTAWTSTYSVAQHSEAPRHGAVRIAWNSTVQYGTVHHNTGQYIQHGTVH